MSPPPIRQPGGHVEAPEPIPYPYGILPTAPHGYMPPEDNQPVFICVKCGALVPLPSTDLHGDWHARMATLSEHVEYALGRLGDPT